MSRFGLGFVGGGEGNDAFTKILLHMDGTNGGTTFTDSNAGGSARTWTSVLATTSTAVSKFGGSSMAGNTSYIDTPDSADFTLGSGDFTIDFWLNMNGTAGSVALFGQVNSAGAAATESCGAFVTAANKINVEVVTNVARRAVVGATSVNDSVWRHIAFVRAGANLNLYVDGVSEGGPISIASETVIDSSNKFSVGRAGEFTGIPAMNGYIDEFRFSVGIARWTANFTPPASPYGP